MTELNLDKIREDIDNIDTQLIELFRERMQKSIQVAEYKQAHGLPVFNSTREKEVLHKVTEQMGEPFDGYARLLFNTIFDVSKSAQNNYLSRKSNLAERIAESLNNTPVLFPKKAVVACQGVPGANSQAACEKLFEVPSIMFFNNLIRKINSYSISSLLSSKTTFHYFF